MAGKRTPRLTAYPSSTRKTQVEGPPFNADTTHTASLATATADVPGMTVSRPAKERIVSTQSAIIAAGLVLLCVLIPVLAGWIDFGGGESGPNPDEEDRAIIDVSMKPLPEVGDGPVVLVQEHQKRRFRDLGPAIGAAKLGEVVLLEFDGEMDVPQIFVDSSITIAAGWNKKKDKPFEPVLICDPGRRTIPFYDLQYRSNERSGASVCFGIQ